MILPVYSNLFVTISDHELHHFMKTTLASADFFGREWGQIKVDVAATQWELGVGCVWVWQHFYLKLERRRGQHGQQLLVCLFPLPATTSANSPAKCIQSQSEFHCLYFTVQ